MNTISESCKNIISLQARIEVLESVLRDTYLKLNDATNEKKLFVACREISENIEIMMPEWTSWISGHCRPGRNGLQKFRCDACKATFQTTDDPEKHHGTPCGCSEGGSYGLVLEEDV